MKKIILAIISFYFVSVLHANANEIMQDETLKSKEKNYLFEIKGAYFLYQDKALRKIFDNSAFLGIFGFDFKTYKRLHTWVDVGYAYDKGEGYECKNKEISFRDLEVKFNYVPASLGLKYVQPLTSKANLYAKIGPNWTYFKSKTSYPYVSKRKSKNQWGACLGIGSWIDFKKGYFNFFIDYFYGRKSFLDSNSNIKIKIYTGGWAFGAGIDFPLN